MDVVVMRPRVEVDPDVTRLFERYDGRERDAIERELGPRLEQLAEGLSLISRAFVDQRFDDLTRAARRLSKIARGVGLERIAVVALRINQLPGLRDPAALSANVARLLRLGEGALSEIWHIQDHQYL